ncbi:MAG: hypothetical protein RBG13Loki_1037 [Promethearchaeota archaeon CR_4]|nr:MAG: hypothetical protein RBG13Loki_1037 [Candidatus Lokiarchaeota archaeon CR_4]
MTLRMAMVPGILRNITQRVCNFHDGSIPMAKAPSVLKKLKKILGFLFPL